MKSLLPWFVLILIFFLSLTIISCGDDKGEEYSAREEYSDDFPKIAEVTKVTTPTNDTTPDYTFSSTEAGTISYGGSCSSSTTISIFGNNTITLDSLSDGTYSDCIIVVRGTTGYLSNILTITTFIVDTTAPTVSSVSTTADNQSSVAITENITVTFSEAMDPSYVTTNTSDTYCAGTIRVSSDNFSSCVRMSSVPVSSNSNRTFTLDPYDNLTSGTTYLTRVTTGVKDTAGNTLSSQYETSSGFTTPLPAPANFTATSGYGQNTLDWDNVTGATSYTVYWGNSTGVSSSSTAITSVSTDSYTHSSLTNGSAYYYKVAAVAASGTGTLSSEANATPVSPPYKLPDTGQTSSYTDTSGEDHDYLINPPSFIINDSDTVTDNNTLLMWQRQDDGTTRTWANAEPYCSGLSLGGQSDWRIPEIRELQTIVDFGKSGHLDATYFTGTDSTGYYWSTNYLGSNSKAWYMRVGHGTVGDLDKGNTLYVRCVRGANTTRSFTDNGDNTTTDTKTRLVWQRSTSGSGMNWESALTSCEALTLASQSDWRLPNIKELFSIVDTSEYNPAIDETYFPATQSADYWSSTTWRSTTTNAWRVDFNGGTQYPRHKTDVHANQTADKYVRCVRGG